MGFWITYAEFKALYPFIPDEMLADWIEKRAIQFSHPNIDPLVVTSAHLSALRYKKRSIVKEALPLFEEICNSLKSKIEWAEGEKKETMASFLASAMEKKQILEDSIKCNEIDIDTTTAKHIEIYTDCLSRLYAEGGELYQQVYCYYEAYINNVTNKKLANKFSTSERTIPRWIESGENYAVHDPAGPRLPALPKPAHRCK